MLLENKTLAEITAADIEFLLTSNVVETASVEFKEKPYGKTDEDKRELVKDVVGMANARGGYIIIGIVEGESGAAVGISHVGNADDECDRIRQICNDNIEPRLAGLNAKRLTLTSGDDVIALYVPDEPPKPRFQRINKETIRIPQRHERTTRHLSHADVSRLMLSDPTLMRLQTIIDAINSLARLPRGVAATTATTRNLFSIADATTVLEFITDRFESSAPNEPCVRLAATPLPLTLRPVGQNLSAVQRILDAPPSARQEGWTLEQHGRLLPTELGWICGSPHGREIEIFHNGHVELHIRGDALSWDMDRPHPDGRFRLFPTALAELTENFVRLCRALTNAIDPDIKSITFSGGLYYMEEARLIGYAPDTSRYRVTTSEFQRGDDSVLGLIGKLTTPSPVVLQPYTVDVETLPGNTAFQLVQQIYQRFGLNSDHIPFFGRDERFDYEWKGGPRA